MPTPPDLSRLQRRTATTRTPFRVKTLLLPTLLCGGTALLVYLVFGNQLRSRIPVETSPVLLLPAPGAVDETVFDSPGEVLAQASGWVEPATHPWHLTPRAGGVLQEVLVLEGANVTNGQLLATIDPTDLYLQAEKLRAKRAEILASRQAADARILAAQAAMTEGRAQMESAEAWLAQAKDFFQRLTSLQATDTSENERVQAERDLAVRRAALAQTTATVARNDADLQMARAERTRLDAVLDQVQADLALADLQVSRTRLLAPAAGRVLRRSAEPGRAVKENGEVLFSFYDPAALQVRVDVPLADAAKVNPGGPVRITTAGLPGETLQGVVDRVTGEADLTRNTVQIKVRLEAPPDRLRPDMLCRAEFLAPLRPTGLASNRTHQGRWIPAEALTLREGSRATVWLVDALTDRVQPQPVRLAGLEQDGLVLLSDGPLPGQRVVLRPSPALRPGALVRVTPTSATSRNP